MSSSRPEPAPKVVAFQISQRVVADLDRRELQIDGAVVPCQPLVFALIVRLCEEPQRVVSKGDLFAALWPGQAVVSEESLAKLVAKARVALGPAGDRLKTARKQGFLLDARVVPVREREPVRAVAALTPPSLFAALTPASGRAPIPLSATATAAPSVPRLPATAAAGEVVTQPRGASPLLPAGPTAAAEPRRAPVATTAPANTSPLPAAGPASESPLSAAAPPQSPPAAALPALLRRRRWSAATLLVVLVLVGGTVLALAIAGRNTGSPPGMAGFGLRREDFAGARPETAQVVDKALAHLGSGNRAQAILLLEAAHVADSRSPIPAALLAGLVHEDQGPEPARQWLIEAKARLGPGAGPYQRLLVALADAEINGSAESFDVALASAIELRPEAWRYRMSRAHHHLAHPSEFPLALSDLRAIDVTALTGPLSGALADRASLGDADAAERILARLPRDSPEERAWGELAAGRIALARGDDATAVVHLDRAAAAGELLGGGVDGMLHAQLLAAAALAQTGHRAEALARFDRLWRRYEGFGYHDRAAETLTLAATLSYLQGDVAGARYRLAEADRLAPPVLFPARSAIALRALEMGYAPALPVESLVAALHDGDSEPGFEELVLAWQAFDGGDTARAAAMLAQARRMGIEDSPFRHSTALLGARLGGPTTSCRVEPPYPLESRYGTCWQMQELAAERATAPIVKPG